MSSVTTRKLVTNEIARAREPKEVQILLQVCSCYRSSYFEFNEGRTEQVARLLAVSVGQIKRHVHRAIASGQPEIVACYRQNDVALTKLAQLQERTPFIIGPCHSFKLAYKP